MSKMDENKPKFGVLVADAFQDTEFFLPKAEIEKVAEIVIISIKSEPVAVWSYFDKIGEIMVDKTIDEINKDDYIGILIPGGAESPTILSKNEAVKEFVRYIDKKGNLVASICRGSLLAAVSGIAKERDITGYNQDGFPDLRIKDDVKANGGIWIEDQPVVISDNLISSRHPDDAAAFTNAINKWLDENSTTAE